MDRAIRPAGSTLGKACIALSLLCSGLAPALLVAPAATAQPGASGPAVAGAAGTVTLSFSPIADTYVDSGAASTSFGSSSIVYVDAVTAKYSFLKFNLSGIGGRTVVGARLRMYNKDGSPHGGRVFSFPSNSWS